MSIVFLNMKMEKDVVVPTKPIFYKRFVENTHVRGWKNIDDELFQNLNCYCQNIKLSLEDRHHLEIQ